MVLFHLGMLTFVRAGVETRLPDLTGRPLPQAREELEASGFTAVADREVHDTRYPEGAVVEQRPAPGEILRRGRKVWLTVSLGVRRTEVPSVAGKTVRQAGIVLEAGGFRPGAVLRVSHPTAEYNAVISQDPPAGSKRAEGTRVALLVSGGRDARDFVLPRFAGLTVREAERILTDHGFRLGEKSLRADEFAARGVVIRQNPPAGSRVWAGMAVDLVVSAGD
jgi:serine/threonine-protein kinase